MGDVAFIGLGVEHATLVRRMEKLAQEARDGKLKVIIAATINSDGDVGFLHMGALSSSHDTVTEYSKVVGMVNVLAHDVNCTLHGMLMAEPDETDKK